MTSAGRKLRKNGLLGKVPSTDGHPEEVSLSEASSQGYPASNIHPDICLNAQTEYETTKFVVSIKPVGSTATLSIESGDISLDYTSVSDGDTVTVTGSETGSYEIKATHDDDSSVTDTATGSVFEFKFHRSALKNTTPAGSANSCTYTNFEVTGVTTNANSAEGAEVTPTWEISVVTNPSTASFSGEVSAELKCEFEWNAFAEIIESGDADGSTVSLSGSYRGLGLSFSGSGTKDICGIHAEMKAIFDDTESSQSATLQYSSQNVSVPWLQDNATGSTNPSGSFNSSWGSKDFTVDTTKKELDVSIRLVTNTTLVYAPPPVTPGSSTGTSLQSSNLELDSFKLSEHDNEFEIK